MFKRKNYFALGAVVMVTLAIFSLPPRATSRLKLAVGSLFLPLFGLANTAHIEGGINAWKKAGGPVLMG